MQEEKDKKLFVSTFILVICHFFGVVGMLTPWRDYFLMTTPVNLIVSTILLIVNHKEFNISFYVFCFTAFVFGYAIELAGITTGKLFGAYSYGQTLGLKILDVPIVMGLNWLMLTYSAGIICSRLTIHLFFKSLVGAFMLVALDFLIEPVAIKFDFWTWKTTFIPAQNYVAWFIAALLLLLLFNALQFNKNNKLATAFYIVQLVFFTLLNIF